MDKKHTYFRKIDGLYFILILALIILQIYLDLRLPDYMSEITLLIQTEGITLNQVLKSGGSMLLCALGSMTTSIINGYFIAKIAVGFTKRLRASVFKKIISFSVKEIDDFSSSSLITRCTNDITQLQTTIAMGLQATIKAPILSIWAITKILNKGVEWTIATGIAVLIMLILMVIIITFTVPKSSKIQKQTDRLNAIARESLIGLRVVRAYNGENYQEEKFETANKALIKSNLFNNRMTALLMPSLMAIMNILTLSIYIIGALLIDEANAIEKLTIFSNMVVFTSYAMQVIMAFMMFAITFIILPRAIVSGRRIREVLKEESSIKDGNKTKGNEGLIGEIEFKNVSFRYPGAKTDAIQNISFNAKKGETVAIIGSTGCGKSTIVNLIPRFYDATGGEIIINGIDVKEYSQKALRDIIGYVSQKSILFSGTVRSNVNYGNNGNEEQLKNAIQISQAAEFVEKLENKYDEHVAQGGSNLSGGQKQRLSIARAICKQPQIYIFDDSFSALDYKTDKILRSELKHQVKDATMIIVAQRIGTIKDADKIIVLDNGKIVGQGKHKQLLEECSVYKQIALSQLSSKELEEDAK